MEHSNQGKPKGIHSSMDAGGPLVIVSSLIVGMIGVAAVCMGGLSANSTSVAIGFLLGVLAVLLFVQGLVMTIRNRQA